MRVRSARAKKCQLRVDAAPKPTRQLGPSSFSSLWSARAFNSHHQASSLCANVGMLAPSPLAQMFSTNGGRDLALDPIQAHQTSTSRSQCRSPGSHRMLWTPLIVLLLSADPADFACILSLCTLFTLCIFTPWMLGRSAFLSDGPMHRTLSRFWNALVGTSSVHPRLSRCSPVSRRFCYLQYQQRLNWRTFGHGRSATAHLHLTSHAPCIWQWGFRAPITTCESQSASCPAAS